MNIIQKKEKEKKKHNGMLFKLLNDDKCIDIFFFSCNAGVTNFLYYQTNKQTTKHTKNERRKSYKIFY